MQPGTSTVEKFDLEPTLPTGQIPARVLVELIALRAAQRSAIETYAEAVTAQATKFSVGKKALRRFIAAVDNDKLADLKLECAGVQQLIDNQMPDLFAPDEAH